MAEIEVSLSLLERLLFVNKADIIGYREKDRYSRTIIFSIVGPSVPDTSKVVAEITEYHRIIKFTAVKD